MRDRDQWKVKQDFCIKCLDVFGLLRAVFFVFACCVICSYLGDSSCKPAGLAEMSWHFGRVSKWCKQAKSKKLRPSYSLCRILFWLNAYIKCTYHRLRNRISTHRWGHNTKRCWVRFCPSIQDCTVQACCRWLRVGADLGTESFTSGPWIFDVKPRLVHFWENINTGFRKNRSPTGNSSLQVEDVVVKSRTPIRVIFGKSEWSWLFLSVCGTNYALEYFAFRPTISAASGCNWSGAPGGLRYCWLHSFGCNEIRQVPVNKSLMANHTISPLMRLENLSADKFAELTSDFLVRPKESRQL